MVGECVSLVLNARVGDYLWSGLDEGVRCNLKMDPIARFSVTDMKTADKMSEVILGLEGISSDSGGFDDSVIYW